MFRVYPSCKRVGSFSVRAHAGLNRIRFTGRVRGRPLGEGGYRLVVRVRGAERDAAAVPIVIAHANTSAAEVRKARATSACSDPVGDFGSPAGSATGSPGSGDDNSGGNVLGAIKDRVDAPLSAAAGAVASAARGVSSRLQGAVAGDPIDQRIFLTVVGLMTFFIALLGAVLLAHFVRTTAHNR